MIAYPCFHLFPVANKSLSVAPKFQCSSSQKWEGYNVSPKETTFVIEYSKTGNGYSMVIEAEKSKDWREIRRCYQENQMQKMKCKSETEKCELGPCFLIFINGINLLLCPTCYTEFLWWFRVLNSRRNK